MTEIEKAIAAKALGTENESLKALLSELVDLRNHKREAELTNIIRSRILTEAKWIGGLFVLAATAFGYTSFDAARLAAIEHFRTKSVENIESHFNEKLLPPLLASIENKASERIDVITSDLQKELSERTKRIVEELAKQNKGSSSNELTERIFESNSARPKAGFVLRKFISPTNIDRVFSINTFRLNLRKSPNGEIVGRQVEGALVMIVSEDGDWVEIKIVNQ